MDLDKEIAKCEKKLDLTRLNLQKIVKIESQPEYEETVPANVRTANSDKVWSAFLLPQPMFVNHFIFIFSFGFRKKRLKLKFQHWKCQETCLYN